jgi:hypothetical protein
MDNKTNFEMILYAVKSLFVTQKRTEGRFSQEKPLWVSSWENNRGRL